MTNKTFLTLHAIIYMVFAFALFFTPSILWPIYGVEINDEYALFLSQHNSIFLGGVSLISFLFRDVQQGSSAAKKILKGLIGTNVLGAIITFYAALMGIFTGFGWSDPLFFSLLALLSTVQLKRNH